MSDQPTFTDQYVPTIHGRPMYYKLDGRTPVPCSAKAFDLGIADIASRRIGNTTIGPGECRVSTVFRGINSSPDNDAPNVFETMVWLEQPSRTYLVRCATWEQAEQQHETEVDAALWDLLWTDTSWKSWLSFTKPSLQKTGSTATPARTHPPSPDRRA